MSHFIYYYAGSEIYYSDWHYAKCHGEKHSSFYQLMLNVILSDHSIAIMLSVAMLTLMVLSVHGQFLQAGLMFANKTRAYPSGAATAVLTNVDQQEKNSGKNTLAYSSGIVSDEVKPVPPLRRRFRRERDR